MAKEAKKETAKDAPKNEVAVQKGGAVSAAMPEFMKEFAGQGGENIAVTDLLVPRLALLQSSSPQVVEQGEKIGEFYHTVLEESLGSELKWVPIIYTKQLILWNPRESGGGILARANWNNAKKEFDAWQPSNTKFTVKLKGVKDPVVWDTKGSVKESGLLNWGTYNPDDEKSQPAATEIHSFLSVSLDHMDMGPIIVAMQRTAVKPARKLLTRLSLSQAPFYGQKFLLTAVDEQNKLGEKFKNFSFKPDGLVEDPELFAQLRGLYERFKGQSFEIKDLDKMQGDTPEGEEGTGGSVAGKVSDKF